jgi:drug/metabolite transporter (DMT)-like permease
LAPGSPRSAPRPGGGESERFLYVPSGSSRYALALVALERAPAASVAAVREAGVIIATALAGVFLKERVGWVRIAGGWRSSAGLLSLA